jgi:hypothetical protein
VSWERANKVFYEFKVQNGFFSFEFSFQKIPKTVLKTRLKTKETTYFDFIKYLVDSLPSHSKRAFSVFLE